MPFKRYTLIYRDVAQVATELLAQASIHSGELSLALATKEDVINAAKWREVIDFRGLERVPPNGGWDWEALFLGQLKAPKRYCMSIKWHDELCGLFLGGISKGKDLVSIHYLDTPPQITPLSSHIVPIAVAFSAVLGGHVSASYIAVYGPNDAMTERLKSDFGFEDIAPYGYRYVGNSPLYRSMG